MLKKWYSSGLRSISNKRQINILLSNQSDDPYTPSFQIQSSFSLCLDRKKIKWAISLENKQVKILKRNKEKDLEEFEGMKAGGTSGKKVVNLIK